MRNSTLNEVLRKVHRDEEAIAGKDVLLRLQEGDADQSEGKSGGQHAIVTIGGEAKYLIEPLAHDNIYIYMPPVCG